MRVVAFMSAEELPRRLDFVEGNATPDGAYLIGPDVTALDLERYPDFRFHLYQLQGETLVELSPVTWSASLENVQGASEFAYGISASIDSSGRVSCSDSRFRSATLTVKGQYGRNPAVSKTMTLYPRMTLVVNSWVPSVRQVWPGEVVEARDIRLNVTTGGETTQTDDLSEAVFRLNGNRWSAQGTALAIPAGTEVSRQQQLQLSLSAWRAGDSEDPFAAKAATIDLMPSASTLGDDFDNIPDGWLKARVGATDETLEKVARADSDGDGYANWEEWVAGTDPKDAGSALRVTGLEVGADGAARVEWAPRAPGRKAVVVGAEALGGPWREDSGAGARFFRVRVSLE